MQQKVELLITEARDLRSALQSTRSTLYRIDVLALSVASGLAVGIYAYRVEQFKLFGPFLLYLVGFLWSTESLRLLRLRDHVRSLELKARELLREPELPPGFETATRGKPGVLFTLRHESLSLSNVLLIGTMFAFSLYLLATSKFSAGLRFGLLGFYLTFGASFWLFDIWNSFKFLAGDPLDIWLSRLRRRRTHEQLDEIGGNT